MVTGKAMRAAVIDNKGARRPVSRVLSAPLPARGDHSSGTRIAARLARPTRATGRECPRVGGAGIAPGSRSPAAPIRSCSRWGLPCRPRRRGRGALLPHRFTLAGGRVAPLAPAVCSLWHFPWGRPRRPLAGTVFPWSPDFSPRGYPRGSGRPAVWRARPAPSRHDCQPRQTRTSPAWAEPFARLSGNFPAAADFHGRRVGRRCRRGPGGRGRARRNRRITAVSG